MSVKVSVKHNLHLLTRTVERIKPEVRSAMMISMEASTPFMLGQLERSAPPEAQGLAKRLQYRIEKPDEDTVRGLIFTQEDPIEAFLALEFGRRGVTITLAKPIPIKKDEGSGETAKKPIEKMGRKEREAWEKERIVWTRKLNQPAQDPKPWLIPTMRSTFPEIVERLRNGIANRFEEIRQKNDRQDS